MAVMVVVPCPTADTNPVCVIVATCAVVDPHRTDEVMFSVVPAAVVPTATN
jgi:hypothetical protein